MIDATVLKCAVLNVSFEPGWKFDGNGCGVGWGIHSALLKKPGSECFPASKFPTIEEGESQQAGNPL